MSCIATPWRYASATPSPVRLHALDVTRNMRPKPPVARSTAFERNVTSSPSAIRYATTPAALPPVRDPVRDDAGRPAAVTQLAPFGDEVHHVVLVVEVHAGLDALLVQRL